MDKTPGRYNLHKLGWKGFEDFIIELNRSILGNGVTPFRAGADEGRDGFFKGQVVGMYAEASAAAKTVVFQCKHTLTSGAPLTLSNLSDEVKKVTTLAMQGDADIYAIFTNRRVKAEDERLIRAEFEKIDGVKACRVFGEGWLEPHIDGNFKLLRRVPRLYGIGDLSQIISHCASQQTQAILEEKQSEQAVFVPTPSYLGAVRAIEEYRMVVLVGPPASGKSAIALNLCMVLGAEDKELEVIKVESADQFTSYWSPGDSKKLFWIDDFFGETTYDNNRASPWSVAYDKLSVARKMGNRFIFTCRDYILKEARAYIKKKKLDFFEDHRIFVEVNDLTPSERQRILYNHIKLGELSMDQKKLIKPFLSFIAGLSGFTPEIARRLGDPRFHKKISYDLEVIRNFIENPIHFFSDVIEELGMTERATITLLLLSNNSLPDPVDQIPPILETAYGVTIAEVRQALTAMSGSLTKLSILNMQRVWQVQHPSMIDAMHEILSKNPSLFDLFITAAPTEVVLRDCSTQESEHHAFVPRNLFAVLLSHVLRAESLLACSFLLSQTDEFLSYAINTKSAELSVRLADGVVPLGRHLGLEVYKRMYNLALPGLAQCKEAIELNLPIAFWLKGCYHGLKSGLISQSIDKQCIHSCLNRFPEFIRTSALELIKEVKHGYSNFDDAEAARDEVGYFFDVMLEEAERLLDAGAYRALRMTATLVRAFVLSDIDKYLRGWASYEDDAYDRWRDDQYDIEPEEDNKADIFSDVDE